MKRFALLVLIVILVFSCSSCKEENKLTSTQVMMDTVVTITLWDSDFETLNSAIELCRQYEQTLSRTIASSDVSKINAGGIVSVSKETAEVLNTAINVAKQSNGAFDITILPLVELWDINNATEPPTQSQIDSATASVDYQGLTITGTSVNANGATIDLGGIAKGYITDKVREYLVSKGVKRAIINLGGNVCVVGKNGNRDYSVGIQKPFGLHGESSAILKISDKTAITSGIYERYFEHEGTIYHHIIDPKTGCPADNEIRSVTIIADNAALADSLSTACLILGVEDGMKLAKEMGVETVFLLESGEIKISDGLKIDNNGTTPTITFK